MCCVLARTSPSLRLQQPLSPTQPDCSSLPLLACVLLRWPPGVPVREEDPQAPSLCRQRCPAQWGGCARPACVPACSSHTHTQLHGWGWEQGGRERGKGRGTHACTHSLSTHPHAHEHSLPNTYTTSMKTAAHVCACGWKQRERERERACMLSLCLHTHSPHTLPLTPPCSTSHTNAVPPAPSLRAEQQAPEQEEQDGEPGVRGQPVPRRRAGEVRQAGSRVQADHVFRVLGKWGGVARRAVCVCVFQHACMMPVSALSLSPSQLSLSPLAHTTGSSVPS